MKGTLLAFIIMSIAGCANLNSCVTGVIVMVVTA